MRTQTSKVANFENIDLKDLRITPASLRLRRVIIGVSIGYIFIFTPVLVYFIWNYMMAQPNVRTQGVNSGGAAKPCANRRLPSLHFSLHKGGRRGAGDANSFSPPPHGNASHGEGLLPSEKYLYLEAGPYGGNASAANSKRVGGGTHEAAAVVARQQAAEKETPGYRILPQAALIRPKVSDDSSSSGRIPAEGPPRRRLMLPRQQQQQQEQPREPGKQPEEAGGGQVEPQSTSRRDYPPAPPPPGINQLPVRIGLQEMADGHGRKDESALDGARVRGRSRSAAGTSDDESGAEMLDSGGNENGGRSGVLYDVGDARFPALARDETVAKYGEEEMDFPRGMFSRNGGKGQPQPTSLDESSYQDGSGPVVDVSSYNATLNNKRLQSHSLSRRQRKDRRGAFYEVGSSKKLVPYANSVRTVASDQDHRDNKRALSPEIQNKTAAELRRLRSEKLKLKLRKQRKMAEQLKDSESMPVDTGGSSRNEPSEKASRVDIAFQKELVQLTAAKKWSRKQVPSMSGRGVRSDRHGGDSAAPSDLSGAEQRMIEGMPSSNKEDNEVLSFAEFFKNHLSPKQRRYNVRDGLKSVQGRRLVIDYAAKGKGKEALVEGFDAGGWPEKPEEPSPTKYTLDPFHPYIARRGAGWDFYNPLKPATERNNARELAEQEFYSPEQQPIGVRRRLSRRFWAAPAFTSAPFFRPNETSITESQPRKGQGETMSPSPGSARGAGLRPAVSAAIRNAVPSFKTRLEGNIQESPQNNLSLTLLGHYEVTNETVDAGLQGLSAHVGRDAKIWRRSRRIDANGGLESYRSVISLETERRDTSRTAWASTREEDEEYPFGKLNRDEAPRSKVSPSDVGTAVNLSAKVAEKGATQTEDYRKGPESHYKATRVVFATHEGQKDITRIEIATSDAAFKGNRGSEPRPSRDIPQSNGPDVAFREVESHKMPGSLDIAPSTGQGAAVQNLAGSGNAAATIPADNSVADKNKSFAFHPRSTRGRVAVDSLGVEGRGGLMNVEPIPIEGPEFNLSAEINVANATTGDVASDWVSLQTSPRNYEDIVPEEERNILSSALHRKQRRNATRFREKFVKHKSSTRLLPSRLTGASNSTQKFEPEAMHLTPPKVGLASPLKGDYTRSRRGLSSPGPAQSGTRRTNLRTEEKDDDFDDFHNAEDTYLRIDVRTVKKLEVPTEPSNVDIRIQNKVRKVAQSTASLPVALDEVVPKGVKIIFNGKRTSSPSVVTEEVSSIEHSSKKEQPLLQTRAPLRVTELTNTSDIAPETKPRYPRDSSQLITESTIAWTDKVARKIVDTSAADRATNVLKPSTSADHNAKDESKGEPKSRFIRTNATKENHHPIGFGSGDVSITAQNLRTEQPAMPPEHDLKGGVASGVTIEILVKKRGSENTPNKGYGVPFVRIAARNVSHTTSSDHTPSPAFKKRALAEEVTTLMPPFQSSKTMAKKYTKSTVPSTRSRVRAVPFVRIAVRNSSRPNSGDGVPSPASRKKALVEGVTTFMPPLHSSGTMARMRTQSTIPSEKSEEHGLSASSEPPAPMADKKGLFDKEARTTNGKISASEMSGLHVADERSPSPTNSEDISVRFNVRERRHPEDEEASTLNNTTLVIETSAQKLPSATPTKQATVKSTSRTQPERKAPTSTMAPADERKFIKGEMPASRTVETERTSKRAPWTSTSLSAASTAKEESIEFTSGTVKHPKNSDNEEIENHDNHAANKPGTPNSTTASSKRHSTVLSSSDSVPRKGRNFVTFGYATKPSKPAISASEPSQHEGGTAASTMRVTQEKKAKTFDFKSGSSSLATSSPSRPSPVKSVSTATTTLPTASDTPNPELGFGDDMLGRLGDENKAPNSTLDAKEPNGQKTAGTSSPSKQPVPTWTVAKPHIEVIPLTTRKERAASKSSRPAGPQERRPQETTTATTEPTAVVFDFGDDEEDEARLHFPMMKIRRRPSTTPRVPAIMDLFGRGLLTSRRATTLRPVLQHHIAVRRGHPEREPTLRPRLEHDIAMKRRHRRSQPPRPYHMTLFHDEPLQAMRIAVRRMG